MLALADPRLALVNASRFWLTWDLGIRWGLTGEDLRNTNS